LPRKWQQPFFWRPPAEQFFDLATCARAPQFPSSIGIIPTNGEPSRCEVRLELDQNMTLEFHRYDIQLLVPAEFATLLEPNQMVNIAIEQDGA
jgi:hypothetical protein